MNGCLAHFNFYSSFLKYIIAHGRMVLVTARNNADDEIFLNRNGEKI